MKQVFLEKWDEFRRKYPEYLNDSIVESVEKMLSCREPDKMGFAAYHCPECRNHFVKVPHSCKSRFCNTCGKIQTDIWTSSCHKLLPNTDYYHLTFTIPKQLRGLFQTTYSLTDTLFRASADTLLSFFEDERHVTPAITSVLHTFGRDMKWNPHIHIILSVGGLDKQGHWKKIEYIPFKMLKERWKVKLLNLLKKRIRETLRQNPSHPKLKFFWVRSFFRNFFEDLYAISWYVYLRFQLIGVANTIKYVGRYTKRPVISETRILNYDGDFVTFIYDDLRDKTITKVTVDVFTFIKRLIRHIPPKSFHVIRHYGLTANRVSAVFKPKLEKLFGIVMRIAEKTTWRQRQKSYRGYDPLICPHCQTELVFFCRAFYSRRKGRFVFLYS